MFKTNKWSCCGKTEETDTDCSEQPLGKHWNCCNKEDKNDLTCISVMQVPGDFNNLQEAVYEFNANKRWKTIHVKEEQNWIPYTDAEIKEKKKKKEKDFA